MIRYYLFEQQTILSQSALCAPAKSVLYLNFMQNNYFVTNSDQGRRLSQLTIDVSLLFINKRALFINIWKFTTGNYAYQRDG